MSHEKHFKDMSPTERECYVVFHQFATADSMMSLQGLENVAKQYDLDYELLKSVVDDNCDKQISFQEFLTWWSNSGRFKSFTGENLENLRQWLESFNKIDLDGNGALSTEELAKFCEAQGLQVDAAQLTASLDKDGNGIISFKEFLLWYNVNV